MSGTSPRHQQVVGSSPNRAHSQAAGPRSGRVRKATNRCFSLFPSKTNTNMPAREALTGQDVRKETGLSPETLVPRASGSGSPPLGAAVAGAASSPLGCHPSNAVWVSSPPHGQGHPLERPPVPTPGWVVPEGSHGP